MRCTLQHERDRLRGPESARARRVRRGSPRAAQVLTPRVRHEETEQSGPAEARRERLLLGGARDHGDGRLALVRLDFCLYSLVLELYLQPSPLSLEASSAELLHRIAHHLARCPSFYSRRASCSGTYPCKCKA